MFAVTGPELAMIPGSLKPGQSGDGLGRKPHLATEGVDQSGRTIQRSQLGVIKESQRQLQQLIRGRGPRARRSIGMSRPGDRADQATPLGRRGRQEQVVESLRDRPVTIGELQQKQRRERAGGLNLDDATAKCGEGVAELPDRASADPVLAQLLVSQVPRVPGTPHDRLTDLFARNVHAEPDAVTVPRQPGHSPSVEPVAPRLLLPFLTPRLLRSRRSRWHASISLLATRRAAVAGIRADGLEGPPTLLAGHQPAHVTDTNCDI